MLKHFKLFTKKFFHFKKRKINIDKSLTSCLLLWRVKKAISTGDPLNIFRLTQPLADVTIILFGWVCVHRNIPFSSMSISLLVGRARPTGTDSHKWHHKLYNSSTTKPTESSTETFLTPLQFHLTISSLLISFAKLKLRLIAKKLLLAQSSLTQVLVWYQ